MNRQPYIPNGSQPSYYGPQENSGGGFSQIKGFVDKIRNPKQHFDQVYNLTLANTETRPQHGQTSSQTFHSTQPPNQQQYYPGKQHEINRQKYNEAISKSRTTQYLKNRTDAVTVQGNPNVKASDFKYDDDEYGEFSFPDPYIKYKIIPAEQYKMALDVTTLDSEKKHLTKGNIIIWDYHGGPNQHFYFQRTKDNPEQFFIINASTGFVLEVPNQSTQDDVQVHMTPRFNEKNQLWKLKSVGKDLFTIYSFCGKVLDVQNQWMRNGVPVVQYKENNGKNQKWMIWPS